jgi:hypothetical protein
VVGDDARSNRSSRSSSSAGTERSIPVKIGRRPAARRISSSASFETPTSGDASTLTSASSS